MDEILLNLFSILITKTGIQEQNPVPLLLMTWLIFVVSIVYFLLKMFFEKISSKKQNKKAVPRVLVHIDHISIIVLTKEESKSSYCK